MCDTWFCLRVRWDLKLCSPRDLKRNRFSDCCNGAWSPHNFITMKKMVHTVYLEVISCLQLLIHQSITCCTHPPCLLSGAEISCLQSQISIFDLAAGWDLLPRIYVVLDQGTEISGALRAAVAAQRGVLERGYIFVCDKSHRTRHAARVRAAVRQPVRFKTNQPTPGTPGTTVLREEGGVWASPRKRYLYVTTKSPFKHI
jgi:hypothetical protein